MNISLHLGAHKTASTYLQNQLQKNNETLLKNGINNLSPSMLRQNGITKAVAKLSYHGFNQSLFDETQSKLDKLIQIENCDTTVIAEENFIGTCGDFKGKDLFYFNAKASLGIVSKLLQKYKVTPFFALRSYETFFPSSYGEALRGCPTFYDFKTYYGNQNILKNGWFDLAKNCSEIFSLSEVIVWDYKSTFNSEFRNSLLDLMGKKNISKILIPYEDEVNTAMPHKAINLLEQADLFLDEKEYYAFRKLLDNRMTWNAADKFKPFNLTEALFLKRKYQSDIQKIKNNLSNVSFLELAEPRTFDSPQL